MNILFEDQYYKIIIDKVMRFCIIDRVMWSYINKRRCLFSHAYRDDNNNIVFLLSSLRDEKILYPSLYLGVSTL